MNLKKKLVFFPVLMVLLSMLVGGICVDMTEAAHISHSEKELHYAELITEDTSEHSHENVEFLCHSASDRALHLSRDTGEEIDAQSLALVISVLPELEPWTTNETRLLSTSPPPEFSLPAEESRKLSESRKILSIVIRE